MCVTCGCSKTENITVTNPETGDQISMSHDEAHTHGHAHSHEPSNAHHHEHSQLIKAKPPTETIQLEKEILGKNQLLAERNRGWLSGRGILALNLVSSPGSGKTTLLECTLNDLKDEFKIGVIEGNQETINDAKRIRATG